MPKTYEVRLIKGKKNKPPEMDVTLTLPDNVYIVDSAEDNGVELPATCRTGNCSNCVGRMVEGEVDQLDQAFLTDKQVKDGWVLLCVAYPRSNCTIKTHQEAYLV
ncbi:2Fe-2S iron-sulfur cluster-binding protein [Candidatus Atelocyanobacterium thalassae]|jgi:ferredoxin|nr:2Fe-2S iron-sulfur cluster-binding protein [Candidatus Atelocyanobacterium thalassa]KFF41289.1 MAG: ferredoxin, (2Fe-2S) [Candidatus Atelocyanobacterium thalassa isolate SIO64986]BDA40040.1 ferredoxin [cyanobacterium endosymbiont of Braarudosphaera bigelowii]|tara:strand:- start:408 stop:722 length:315 start_codon:yes stop_codon:yes gene_type:complete